MNVGLKRERIEIRGTKRSKNKKGEEERPQEQF